MKYKYLYIMWAGMYLLCAGLGFLSPAQGLVFWLLFFIGMLFFVPPVWILTKALREQNRRQVKALLTVSAAWLGLTLVLLIVNFLSVASPEAVGTAMYYFLTVLSSPMICSQIWLAPMFCFGCLLTASWQYLQKK